MQVSENDATKIENKLLENHSQLLNYIKKNKNMDGANFDIEYFINSIIKNDSIMFLGEKMILAILNGAQNKQINKLIDYLFAKSKYDILKYLFDDKFEDYHKKIENKFDEMNDCKFGYFYKSNSKYHQSYLYNNYFQ